MLVIIIIMIKYIACIQLMFYPGVYTVNPGNAILGPQRSNSRNDSLLAGLSSVVQWVFNVSFACSTSGC